MKRLKRVGLCAVLALAFTSIGGVASASASSGFLPDSYPATIAGSPTGEVDENVFEFGASSCSLPLELDDQATARAPSPSTVLIPINPYSSCSTGGLGTAEISNNGCLFILNPGQGTFDIGPAGCGPIKFDWSGTGCDGYLYPKSGLSATYTNNRDGSTVDVVAQATGLRFDMSVCFGSPFTASYDAHWTISAEDQVNDPTDVQVASIPGAYLAGAGSDDEEDQPRIEAETYTTSVSSDSSSAFALTGVNGAVYSCAATDYSADITEAAATLPVDASLSSCSLTTRNGGRFPVVGDMKSCHLDLGVLNMGPNSEESYSGDLGVACDQGGDAIELRTYLYPDPRVLLCTVTITPQSGLTGVLLDNVFDTETGIGVTADVSGVDYSQSGNYCSTASETDGALTTSTSLFGV